MDVTTVHKTTITLNGNWTKQWRNGGFNARTGTGRWRQIPRPPFPARQFLIIFSVYGIGAAKILNLITDRNSPISLSWYGNFKWSFWTYDYHQL